MDIKNNYKEKLILLIVTTEPKLSNSYDLLKVLEWKFDFFDPRNIISYLIQSGMLTVEVKEKIKYYKITRRGLIYLNENTDILKNVLYYEFQKQEDFLNILFKKFALSEED